VAAFAFMRWGVRGLLILAPIMLGAYLLAGLQQPAGLVGEDIGKIIMAIPVYCVVFIMGIIIAMAIDGEEPRKAMWLAPLVVLLAPMGSLLLFTPPVLVFLAICYWRTRKELNRDNYLSRNSFNIYLFHWPLILPLASRAFVFYLGMDNILGYALAIATAILLCPVAYKVAKALRLNRLFE
jgi:peptidoglycan/LPS O-acetylase OafA/YrhL